MSKVLLVVSATLANASPTGPRKDYCVLADKLGAEVIDYASVEQSWTARLVKRTLGMAAAQAWLHQFVRGQPFVTAFAKFCSSDRRSRSCVAKNCNTSDARRELAFVGREPARDVLE